MVKRVRCRVEGRGPPPAGLLPFHTQTLALPSRTGVGWADPERRGPGNRMTQDRNRLNRSLRTTLLGLGVNAALSAIKIAAGILGHSAALVADGVESLADVVSSIIVWRAVVVAAEPPDHDHPYGHGKAEAVAALVVGILLLGAAGWIVFHAMGGAAVQRAMPHPFTLVVLLGVIVLKEGLYRYVMREALALESVAVHSDAWHHRSDAITSLAAGVGITVALLGGPDYRSADNVAAMLASGVIAWNGWVIFAKAFDELMDASPDQDVIDRIRALAGGIAGVILVEKCIVRKTGGSLLVDMHVHVDGGMSVNEAHRIAHEVKDAVRSSMPQVLDVLIHLEPALPAGVSHRGASAPVPPGNP